MRTVSDRPYAWAVVPYVCDVILLSACSSQSESMVLVSCVRVPSSVYVVLSSCLCVYHPAMCLILCRQELVHYYQENSLEVNFPGLCTTLSIPYKEALEKLKAAGMWRTHTIVISQSIVSRAENVIYHSKIKARSCL